MAQINTVEEGKELLNKTLIIVEKLEQRAKVFGKGILVLSILDCIFGILAIFCTSLTAIAFLASATSLTTITVCGRVIQISKIVNLEKSLRTMNIVSIGWFVQRYGKYLKQEKGGNVKVETDKISRNRLIACIVLVVGLIFGIVSYFVPAIAIGGDTFVNFIVSGVIEVVAIILALLTKGRVEMTEEEKAKFAEHLKASSQKAAQAAEAKKAKLEAKLAKLEPQSVAEVKEPVIENQETDNN